MSSDEVAPDVTVDDLVLAKIAAQAASEVPGVARLAPTLTTVIKSTLTKAARTLVNQPEDDPGRADPGAVEIDRGGGDLTAVTVRIIATGNPTVRLTVDAVQLAVHHAIRTQAPTPIEVTVMVIDAEPSRDARHTVSP